MIVIAKKTFAKMLKLTRSMFDYSKAPSIILGTPRRLECRVRINSEAQIRRISVPRKWKDLLCITAAADFKTVINGYNRC